MAIIGGIPYFQTNPYHVDFCDGSEGLGTSPPDAFRCRITSGARELLGESRRLVAEITVPKAGSCNKM